MLAHQITPTFASRNRFEQLASALQPFFASRARQAAQDHWMFEVKTGGGRSQVVHLLLERLDETSTARVIIESPIGPLPHRFDGQALLRKNAALDEGAFCIEDFFESSSRARAYLTFRASRHITKAAVGEMRDLIEQAAMVADGLEKDLFAHDLL